jgi:hypothetical protein
MNRNERITFSIIVEQASQKWLRRWANVAQTKFSLFACGRAVDAPGCLIQVLQQHGNLAEQHGPGRCDANMMTRALEHFGTEGMFQLLDRAAQGRLGDVQAFRRPRETQFFRDGLKIAKLAQFHASGGNTNTALR